MGSRYDAIYLSPHLDDVALSCGGQIFQRTERGEKVLIATVMAGDNPQTAVSTFVQSLHDRWALQANPVAERRAEDRAACEILGADFVHLSVPDCIYRLNIQANVPFYLSNDDIFGMVKSEDRAQVAESLISQLQELPTAAEWFVPLSIGNHVDHQLTRWAAETVFSDEFICYYEDYPYARSREAMERSLIFIERNGWESKTIPLSAAALTARLNAITAYASQLSTFFKGQHDLARQVSSFVESVGGERIWFK